MTGAERELMSGTFMAAEIAGQPGCRRCGTSWFVGQAYAVLRETAGVGEPDAFAAAEFPGTIAQRKGLAPDHPRSVVLT